MDSDEIERPVVRNLFRQSSVETRLTPSVPSDSEDEDSAPPKIVNATFKNNLANLIQKTDKSSDVQKLETISQVQPPLDSREEKRALKNVKCENDTFKNNLESVLQKRNNNVNVQKEVSIAKDTSSLDTSEEINNSKNVKFEKNTFKNNLASVLQKKNNSGDGVQNDASITNDLSVTNEEMEGFKTAKSDDNVTYRRKSHSHFGNHMPPIRERQQFRASTTAVKDLKLAAMATPRPKSPRPTVPGKKDEKEETFWEKIGTLGRKKRIKEVQEVQAEGKYAIDSPGSPNAPEIPPEDYTLDDNEERAIIQPRSMEDPRLRELVRVLIDWINDELADQRIIVQNIEEDLYDGQVLQKLLEKLTGHKLDVPEVTQSEEGQRQKLFTVLENVNLALGLPRRAPQKWSVESIHSKNVVSILHLLVALARHFRAPVRLPENVSVAVVVVQKNGQQLYHRTIQEEITSRYDDLGMRCERDAFDTLFDHAADKLEVVKKSLITFVNKHLVKVNLEVNELETQFHDGVYLCLLMGLLEGFFVPLYDFYLTPQDHEQKVHNVSVAFELMQDCGLPKPKARAEDIVNLDLKSTLRVLYNLFTKYKSIA